MHDNLIGKRVVRGPDWKWGDQDGGEGSVGTVIAETSNKLSKLETGIENETFKVITVLWDIGTKAEYRVGYNSAFDLRVIDDSASGIIHPDVLCDGCRVQGITGIMWQCNECPSRLCTTCLTNAKHDSSHVSFKRYDRPSSHPVEVRYDPSKPKFVLRGMFPGAKVKRGYSWSYNDEDGGDGVVGEIVPIVNPSEKTVGRTRVKWPNNQTHYYRLGSKGKVDLEGVQVVANGQYQPHMFPVLYLDSERKSLDRTSLSVGDNVRVSVDKELLRELQDEYDGLNPEMIKCLEKVGTVQRVTERGVSVYYDDLGIESRFNPLAISRTTPYSVGEFVCIRQDFDIFQQMQMEFGKTTALSLGGETGRIIRFSKDGGQVDVEIHKSCREFQVKTLNIDWVQAVELKPQIKSKMDNLRSSLSSLVVEAAAEGQLSILKELLSKYGAAIDSKDDYGRSPLHMACRRGQLVVVKMLLEYKASVELEDNEGNRAVHHAIEGNQLEILELLISKSVHLDFSNKKQLTALHLSVNKSFTECARILVKNQCDVNKQDDFGDTPLHMAVLSRKGFSQNQVPEIIDIIVSSTRVDLNIQNKLGSNVLHLAVAIGNIGVVKYLLNSLKNKNQNRMEKSTLTALLEAKTKYQGFTPLLLAIYRGNYSIIELLVEAGSDLSVVDREGDSSIYLAALFIKRQQCGLTLCELPNKETAPIISEMFEEFRKRHPAVEKYPALALMGYLIRRGCNWQTQKSKIADVIDDSDVINILDSFAQPAHPYKLPAVDYPLTLLMSGYQRFSTANNYFPNDKIFLLKCDFSRYVSHQTKLLRNITTYISEETTQSNHKRKDIYQELQFPTWISSLKEHLHKLEIFSPKSGTSSSVSSQTSSNDGQDSVVEIDNTSQFLRSLELRPNANVLENETSLLHQSAQSYGWKIETRSEYRGADRIYVKDGLGNTYSKKKGNEVFQCTANVDQNGKKKKCRATVKREFNPQTSESTFRILTQHEPHWPKKRFLDGQNSSNCSEITTLQLDNNSNKIDKELKASYDSPSYKRRRKELCFENPTMRSYSLECQKLVI